MTSAREFTARLAELLRREQGAMADFLIALADFDRRRLWLELGHASLFAFLHRELGLSAGAAQYRKTAAELVQRFPEVAEPLRDGRLCLTTIIEVAKVLTPENRDEVLPRFFRLSRREAQVVAAAIRPAEAPPRREVITSVRPASPASASALALALATQRQEPSRLAPASPGAGFRETPSHSFQPVETLGSTNAPGSETCGVAAPAELPEGWSGSQAAPVAASYRAREQVEPLTAELARLHVTVSRRFLEKLDAARAALSHARPGASAEELLEAGLDLLLAQAAKRKGIVEKPRNARPPAGADHVPAHVKSAVWTRDGGRCQWPVASGGVCGSTLRVELDHVVPRAKGGPSTVDNVRLLCGFPQRPRRAARLRGSLDGPVHPAETERGRSEP